jgi:hypothetical protein
MRWTHPQWYALKEHSINMVLIWLNQHIGAMSSSHVLTMYIDDIDLPSVAHIEIIWMLNAPSIVKSLY